MPKVPPIPSPVMKATKLPPGPWRIESEAPTSVFFWHDTSSSAVKIAVESTNVEMTVWTTLTGVEALRDACNALLAEADSIPAQDDPRGEADR